MTAPTLTLSHSDAARRFERQIDEAQRLLSLPISDDIALAQARWDKSAWSLRNRQLLFQIFEDNSGITGYGGTGRLSTHASLALQVEHLRMEIRAQLDCLKQVQKQVG